MTTNATLRTRRCGIGARPSVRRFDASPCQRRIAGTRAPRHRSPRPAPTASVADASSPIRYRMLYYPPESAEGCFRSVSGTEGTSPLTAGSTIHTLSSIQEIRP